MARKPMISRTFTATKVNALCINLETCEPFNKVIVLPRVYKDSKKLDKALAEVVNDLETKYVHAVSVETENTLYGMTEQQFIENAVKLDPTTRKPIED